MKSLLFVAIIAAAIVGSQAQLRGLRASGSGYEKYSNKGCRTSSGSKGSVRTGEYELYRRLSRSSCKRKCQNSSSKCYGYEYSSKNGGKCEVWMKPIDEDELERVSGLDCYIDEGYSQDDDGGGDDDGGDDNFDDDGGGDDDGGDDDGGDDDGGDDDGGEPDFDKYEDKGCRTKKGKKGSKHFEYDLYHHLSKTECKKKCIRKGRGCTGWEYSSSGKCEVWKEPISKSKLETVRNLDCYIKS